MANFALDADFKDFWAIALAVAILAAEVNVAQELHFYVFKT